MNAKWEWLRPVCKRNRIELQLDAKGNPRARMLAQFGFLFLASQPELQAPKKGRGRPRAKPGLRRTFRQFKLPLWRRLHLAHVASRPRPSQRSSIASSHHAAGAGYEPASTAAATAAATPSCTAAPSRAPSYCAPDCASAPGCWRDPPKRDVFSHHI